MTTTSEEIGKEMAKKEAWEPLNDMIKQCQHN
jgi:hypothetical protein